MFRPELLQPIHREDLVRLGRDNDGGYILPSECLPEIRSILSYGLNKDWSLEKDFFNRYPNVQIIGYDHTLSILSLVRFSLKCLFHTVAYTLLMQRKRFKKAALGVLVIPEYFSFIKSKCAHFQNRIWHDRSENSKTIDDTILDLKPENQNKIFMKMDIEGAEYTLIDSIVEHQSKIDLLAIEFHEIEKTGKTFESVILKLKSAFEIVHIHGNNYAKTIHENGFTDTLEITFLNKRLCSDPKPSHHSYPIPKLDQPNKISRPDSILTFTSKDS